MIEPVFLSIALHCPSACPLDSVLKVLTAVGWNDPYGFCFVFVFFSLSPEYNFLKDNNCLFHLFHLSIIMLDIWQESINIAIELNNSLN